MIPKFEKGGFVSPAAGAIKRDLPGELRVPLSEADGPEIRQLETQIAYSAARSDIECYCIPRFEIGIKRVENRWWDTHPCPEQNDPELQETIIDPSVRYLELRGLIVRHPSIPGWVRIKDA